MALSAAQVAAIWAPVRGAFEAVAADVKSLTQQAAALTGPLRSATPPVNPVPWLRWVELDPDGNEIYDQPWVRRNNEWQLDRLYVTGTGSGRTSGGGAPRMDLGALPSLPGVAGFRLKRATVRMRLDGPGSWTVKARRFNTASSPSEWLAPMAITGSGSADFSIPSGAAAVIDPVLTPAIELNLIKGNPVPDSIFVFSCQWAAVRA